MRDKSQRANGKGKVKEDFWFGCTLSRSSQNNQGNKFFSAWPFPEMLSPFPTPNHEVEPKEIHQPLVYTICSCLAALTPGLPNPWQLNFSLILSSIQSYKFLFPCKEQASKTSQEGYIRYGSYSLFLNYFPSEKQYVDYIADKIISIPDSRVWEGFWRESGRRIANLCSHIFC